MLHAVRTLMGRRQRAGEIEDYVFPLDYVCPGGVDKRLTVEFELYAPRFRTLTAAHS